MLYRTPLRMLSDLLSPKALERILDGGARERGKSLAELSAADLAEVLKRDVFKRLQSSVPAPLAKKRVQDVLAALAQEGHKGTEIRNEDALLEGLEASAKRFSLYFDWPEVQKLRALLGVARAEMSGGKSVPGLIDEGMSLIAALERRLGEELVGQAGDLAELKADSARVSGVGGPKLRRLEGLIAQIEGAQRQDTLLGAEVERARRLALELRKLIESSVIAPSAAPPAELQGAALLTPEAISRLAELDRAGEARELADLARFEEAVLRARSDLAGELAALTARSANGEVLGALVGELRERLARERLAVLEAQRAQLERLGARAETLGQGAAQGEAAGVLGGTLTDARLALDVALATLSGGALASEELARLEDMLGTLEASRARTTEGGRTEQLLALQRETHDLETAARDVPGAEAELAPRLARARTELARGEVVSLEALWALLEKRMAEQAREREDFDVRADAVIAEYDCYRSLAGETVQKLGRLADTLRRVRRLGALSTFARGQYEDALGQAEALLGEARAEFEAARELTSTFGADALSDLLGVFDTGGGGFLNEPPHEPLAEPLAAHLTDLAARGGARLALLRGENVTWGEVGEAQGLGARDLSKLLAGRAHFVSVEFDEGGLLAARLDANAVLVARVAQGADLQAWRARLLEARGTLR